MPSLAAALLVPLLAPALAEPTATQETAEDPRDAYDVQAYRLDLQVDPETETLSGTVAVEAVVVADELAVLVLDVHHDLVVSGVVLLADPVIDGERELGGRELDVVHDADRLRCELPAAVPQGGRVAIAVTYTGRPRSHGSFDGFHWAKTESGAPWVNTSCQGLGAHTWWPCKASFFNADDKHERLFVNLTVPAGLHGVSNGRLAGRSTPRAGWETFHWRHPYPCETYAVTINVAPYVVVESTLQLDGLSEPLPFVFYVLPENEAKARLQFRDVPELLAVFGRAFGPFPFPESKFALVETNFWGMEHSTAVAYGSSYPAWCRANGTRDRWAGRNRWFDYILVHEVAHEWWGNAVSAQDWGHFWIHEGFGTYAEGVFVELTRDRAAADEYFDSQRRGAQNPRGRLYRGDDPTSGEAYSGLIYYKGSWVLNTLRHYVDDDDAWWRSLRAFNLEHRYGNATTEDFRAILERETGRDWEQFFDEWFYGVGFPRLTGTVRATAAGLAIEIENEGSNETGFHVPLDVRFRRPDGETTTERVWLDPGPNSLHVACERPTDVEVVNLRRVLGRHRVKVSTAGATR